MTDADLAELRPGPLTVLGAEAIEAMEGTYAGINRELASRAESTFTLPGYDELLMPQPTDRITAP